jgi:hypothetical protein
VSTGGSYSQGDRLAEFGSSFRSIGAGQIDSPIFTSTRHPDAPWVAADLAVLNEGAIHVRLDVDLQVLAAKRTRDQKLVCHLRSILLQGEQAAIHNRQRVLDCWTTSLTVLTGISG